MRTTLILLSSLALASVASALDFNATYDPTATAQEIAAMQGAMAAWSARLSNPVTLNVAFVADSSLGSANSGFGYSGGDNVAFSGFKAALAANAVSTLDATAVSYLQSTTTDRFDYLLNGSTDAGGATHLTSSGLIFIVPALGKALGLGSGSPAGDPDFTIYYSPDASRYDYDRTDGIDPTLRDFGGVMRSQLGQAMGGLDTAADILDEQYGSVYSDADIEGDHAPIDLFRYETFGGVTARSLTVGTMAKAFSVDGGATALGQFHTGINHGDGYMGSAYIGSQGLFHRPTLPGQLIDFSALDLQAMDAIGWNVNPVPEPASFAALGLGALALLRRRRK